jgi:hypothetical protein
MASPLPFPLPAGFTGFSINRSTHIPGGSVTFDVKAQPGSDVLAALVANTAFPARKVELGEISIQSQAEKAIPFDGGKGTVTFSGKANVYSGIAILDKPSDISAILVRDRVDDHIAEGLSLEHSTRHRYVLLRWGYDLQGAAKGSIALGVGGAASFGAEAKRLGAYAVIRQLEPQLGARSAIAAVVDSWMLPTQFRQLDDLAPGTWIVTEVDGSLAIKLGAKYGYDFNWVREAVTLGGLSGDIGLKIQLGVSATFGFETSGQYAIALGRPLEGRRLRFQLFRLNRKGLSFAFSAAGSAQASFNGLLPDNFDDFIGGVFGVHGLQVLKDLDRWTDPDQKLSDLIADVSSDYARQFLKAVTGIDPEQAFESARARLVSLLEAWHQLPHSVASTVYTMVQKDVPALAVLKPTLSRFANESAVTFKGDLETLLSRVDFFNTPFGRWLESAALGPVLGAISDTSQYAQLQAVAKQTLAVLDGSLLERTLVNLQRELADRLGLAQIESVIDQTTFDKVDEWLKARLSDFLGQAVDVQKIQEIRTAIHRLLALRQTFFEQARNALTRKYEFQVIGTYQKTTTRTALIDLGLDFDDANPAELAKLVRDIIDGDFNQVLLHEFPGVTLNQAVLTHEVKRQTHLEVTLPFFHSEIDHINKSLAKVEAVDSDRGRILLYDLSADDIVTAKRKFSSRFHLQGRFTKGSRLRVFDDTSMTHSYSFRQAVSNMRRKAFESQMKTYVDEYFPGSFQGGDMSLSTWVADLDRTIDQVLDNGPDNFGNTLMSLEVSAPSRLVAAWAKAPLAAKAAEYRKMSLAVQTHLKRLIPLCHFQNLDEYKNRISSAVLLVYAACPPATGIVVRNGSIIQFKDTGDVYWDFETSDRLEAMANHGLTLAHLRSSLVTIHETLQQAEGIPASVVEDYQPKKAQLILNAALGDPGREHLRNLLIVERSVIRKAHKAGQAIAKAMVEEKPDEAQKQLATFGAEVTDAFNNGITSNFSGPALRPLGTMVFLEAARVFDPVLEAQPPSAILEVTVLKDKPAFEIGSFIEGEMPKSGDIVRAEKMVSLA